MANTIQIKRGTAAALTSANPALAAGEPCIESDTGGLKIGDGATAWNSLAYAGVRNSSGSSTGTGSEQTIAHGLGATPKRVYAYPTEDPAGTVFVWKAPTIAEGAADATNIYITVTSGKDFTWIAEVW